MISVLTLLAACGHKVNVSYVSPAEVDLDLDVEKVLVINRSVAGTEGQVVLDLAEGLATGEGFDTDRDTSEAALAALREVLEQTDRFEVVSFRVDGERVDTSLWDGVLDERKIARLCASADCDAIVALDSLDTDTRLVLTDPVDGVFEGTAATVQTSEGQIDLAAQVTELSTQPVGSSKSWTLGKNGKLTLAHEESDGAAATQIAATGVTPQGEQIDKAVPIQGEQVKKLLAKLAIDSGPIQLDLSKQGVVNVLTSWEPTTLITLDGKNDVTVSTK
jgi:hypothetical protein